MAVSFSWKMQTLRTNSAEQQRAAQAQPTQTKENLAFGSGARANEPQPGENKIFSKWIWESANGNALHFISGSMARSRATILFLGSLWSISFTLGHCI